MVVNVAQFEFTANTSTGNQTIATGLGFTPTGYIIWMNYNTANATYQNGHGMMIGFSNGTNTYSSSCAAEDASGASDSQYMMGADFRFPILANPSTTPDAIATHSSFGSGTIVINWSNAPTAAYKFYGIAFGGDISCEASSFQIGRTTAGNQSYTTTMSNPQIGFFLSAPSISAPPLSSTSGHLSFGVAVSSSKRALLTLNGENGQLTMDTWSVFDNTGCIANLSPTTSAMDSKADFVSWDTNGFTLNWTDPPLDNRHRLLSFVLKGANFDMGTVAKRTSTGTTTINPSNVGTVKGIMLFSGNKAVSTSVTGHARFSLGAASSTTVQGGCWTGDKTGSADSETATRAEDSNIFVMATEHATATSSTTEAIANISAMGTDTFTLTYSTATATAMDLVWVAIGEAASSQQYSRNVNESSVSISESLARIQTRKFTIAETAITVSESLARIPKYLKAISDTTITVNETLARIAKYTKTISNEPSITTNDSIARWISVTKTLAEPSISINDSIQGVLFYLRTISNETAITTNDSIVRLLTATRTITTEPSISINDTLARIQSIIKTITEDTINTNDTIIAGLLYTALLFESRIKWYYSLLTRKIPEGSE